MSDLEEIRKRKLAELQARQDISQNQAQEEAQLQQQLEELEAVVKQLFTKEALERYGNIKTAYPEKAAQLLMVLGQAINQGHAIKIDDEKLRNILKRLTPKKKDIKIKRI